MGLERGVYRDRRASERIKAFVCKQNHARIV